MKKKLKDMVNKLMKNKKGNDELVNKPLNYLLENAKKFKSGKNNAVVMIQNFFRSVSGLASLKKSKDPGVLKSSFSRRNKNEHGKTKHFLKNGERTVDLLE